MQGFPAQRNILAEPVIVLDSKESSAAKTAISSITGSFVSRLPGRELAEKSTFEEVAYLILHGELPKASELAERPAASRASVVPGPLVELLGVCRAIRR